MNIKKFLSLLFFLLIGFSFITLIPAFQKPDERYHYYEMISSVSYIKSIFNRKPFKMYVDEASLPGKSFSGIIAHNYDNKFPLSVIRNNLFKRNNFVYSDKVLSINWRSFFSYTPGIFFYYLFGQFFPFLGFYIARFSFFLFFSICLWWSLKNIKGRYRYFIYLYCCIPMIWQQVTAISYDAVLLSLVLVIYTLIINSFICKKIDFKNLLFLFVFLLWASLSKIGNETFMFLILLFPFKKLFNKFSKLKLYILYLLVFLFCFIFFIFSTHNTGIISNNININQLIQRQLLLRDPFHVVNVIFSTIKVQSDFYIRTFLGGFGWLDYYLSWPIYLLIVGLFVSTYLNFFKKNVKPILSYSHIVFIFILTLLNLGIIFGSMYLTWTPAASSVILGVQGRYFLPLLLFFLLAISELFLKVGLEKVKKTLYSLFIIVIFVSFLVSTYYRYYDYSKTWSNVDDLKYKIELINNKNLEQITLDREISIEIPVSGEKFSGFQFITDYTNNKKFLVPYIYSILDNNGNVIKKGYISVAEISEGISRKTFGIIILDTNKVILKIKPFLQDKDQEYISLIREKDSGQYLIDLLYISN